MLQRLGWLERGLSHAERYVAFADLCHALRPDDPRYAARILWHFKETEGFVGIAPKVLDVCVEAAELASDFRPVVRLRQAGAGGACRRPRPPAARRGRPHQRQPHRAALGRDRPLPRGAHPRAPAARGGGQRLPLRPVCRVDPRRRRWRPRLPPLGDALGRRVRRARRLGGRERPAAPRGRCPRAGAPAARPQLLPRPRGRPAPTGSSSAGREYPSGEAFVGTVVEGRRAPSVAPISPTTSSPTARALTPLLRFMSLEPAGRHRGPEPRARPPWSTSSARSRSSAPSARTRPSATRGTRSSDGSSPRALPRRARGLRPADVQAHRVDPRLRRHRRPVGAHQLHQRPRCQRHRAAAPHGPRAALG